MFKDILLKQQPVVYHTLKNALENNKLAHAYMFSGPSGTLKKETAILLAQSLICNEKGFACETCETCERIKHFEYTDMIYIDGREVSIKKDDIVKLQKVFNKTGLERKGKKVYILDHAENATVDALNSLLKFLEEPTNDMVAILIVEQMERVLPTIISRCQNLPFTPLKADLCFEEVKSELPELDAYMLSRMVRQKSEILAISESDDYQHAMFVVKGIMDCWDISTFDALLFLQLEGFGAKQKKYGKVALTYVIDMLLVIFKDAMKGNSTIQDTWYQGRLTMLQKQNIAYIHILQVLMQSRDKLLRSVNIQLLIDQMIYKMKEVIS